VGVVEAKGGQQRLFGDGQTVQGGFSCDHGFILVGMGAFRQGGDFVPAPLGG
jgi:hypothetical protein